MLSKLTKHSGFAGIIGLIFATAIAVFIFFLASGNYFRPNSSTQEAIKSVAPEAKINTGSYSSVLESTTKQIRVIEQQGLDRPNEIMREMDKMQGN